MAHFQLRGEIESIATIAEGHRIHDLARLNRRYGKAHWRKMKGIATIELRSGAVRRAELHWYEAHGIGRKELKFKHYVD